MNRNRKRPRRPAFTHSEITAAARIRGCRCNPDISHRHVDGIPTVTMLHDYSCPAIDGPQLLLRRPRHQSAADFAAGVAEMVREIEEEL